METMSFMRYKTTYQSMYNDALKNVHEFALKRVRSDAISTKPMEQQKKDSCCNQANRKYSSPKKNKVQNRRKKFNTCKTPLYFAWSLIDGENDDHYESITNETNKDETLCKKKKNDPSHDDKENIHCKYEIEKHEHINPDVMKKHYDPKRKGKKSVISKTQKHSGSLFFTDEVKFNEKPISEYSDQYQWNRTVSQYQSSNINKSFHVQQHNPKKSSKLSESCFGTKGSSSHLGRTSSHTSNPKPKLFTSLQGVQREKQLCSSNNAKILDKILNCNSCFESSDKRKNNCIDAKSNQENQRSFIENIPYPRKVSKPISRLRRQPLGHIHNNSENARKPKMKHKHHEKYPHIHGFDYSHQFEKYKKEKGLKPPKMQTEYQRSFSFNRESVNKD